METEEKMTKTKRPSKRTTKGKIMIVLSVIFSIMMITYIIGGFYFNSHFFQNTTIEGIDVSGKTSAEVIALLDDKIKSQTLTLTFGDGSTVELNAEDFKPTIKNPEFVDQFIDDQNSWLWFAELFDKNELSSGDFVAIDEANLNATIESLQQTKGDHAPQDAYVSFVGSAFAIVPETLGNVVDVTKLSALVKEQYLIGEESIDVLAADLYQQASVKSDNSSLANKLEAAQKYCNASITYQPDSEHKFVLDQNTLLTWLTQDSNGNWIKDDSVFATKAKAFIRTFTRYYYTLGISRQFKTAAGNTITVSGGTLGQYVLVTTETNKLLEMIANQETTNRTPALFGYGYQSNSGIGDTYVEINLSAQKLYMIQNGKIVFQTDQIVSGLSTDPARKTPAGCYYVYYKQLNRVLRGTQNPDGTWPYEVPVKYWMAFNGGIGMHDATYRSSFGGKIYTYNGSHGCVNMRYSEAAKMYEYTKIGTPVICYY